MLCLIAAPGDMFLCALTAVSVSGELGIVY